MEPAITDVRRRSSGRHSRHRHAVYPPESAGFTLLELIGAMAILILLMSWFYAGLRGIYRLQTVYQNESNALVVLNNVLVRVEVAPVRDEARIHRIFEDEFRKSALAADAQCTPSCKNANGTIALAILKANGRPLAQLELKQ